MGERIDYYNVPIAVTDASSMFRTRVHDNTPPYTVQVTKLNNRLVDDWEKKVLRKMADQRGMIPSGKVLPSWRLYYEGRGIQSYVKVRDMIPRHTKEQLDFWVKFFEDTSLEDLHSYGVGVVSFGWGIIENELRLWSANQKWDKLFSKTEDPLEWEKMAPSHRALLTGEVLPFWDLKTRDKIAEKVGTVLSLQISSQYFRQRITANMKPYTKVVAELNNSLIDMWEKETLGKVTKRLSLSDPKELALWSLWYEGKGVQMYMKIRDQLPKATPKQLAFWKDLLEKKSLEELHGYGIGVVSHAFQIIQCETRMWIADQKWEKIFSQGEDLKSWLELASKNEDLAQGKILPFWDEKTLQKVSIKIGTILSAQINPNN